MQRTDSKYNLITARKTRRFLLPGRFFASPETKLTDSVRLPGIFI